MSSDTADSVLDILIIGGGPIGIACALESQRNNLRYVVIEKGALTNSLFNYPLDMTFFSTSEKLEIGEIPFISNNPKPKRNEALEYYRRVADSNKLNIKLYEEVCSVHNSGDFFEIKTSKGIYKSRFVIVCTGFYDIPQPIGVPGEDLPKVQHYYKEAHPYAMQKTIVVGASNSSVDAALEVWRKGGEVTMIVRGPGIGERVKYWVKPDIENRIREGSIKAYFNSNIQEIKEDKVIVRTPEGIKEIENDFVLALTGYRPDFEFLQKIGVELSLDEKLIPVYNPETMETNVDGLYLAGVICGGMETHKWFIENSRIHAELIIQDIQKKIQINNRET